MARATRWTPGCKDPLIISGSSCFPTILGRYGLIQEGTYYWHMSDAMVVSRPQSWRDLYLRLSFGSQFPVVFMCHLSELRLSIVMGVPPRWMVYFMENPTKMDDDWGQPCRTPPFFIRTNQSMDQGPCLQVLRDRCWSQRLGKRMGTSWGHQRCVEQCWRTLLFCDDLGAWNTTEEVDITVLERWKFPKEGYIQIIHLSRISPYKPTSYGGTPMAMETSIWRSYPWLL